MESDVFTSRLVDQIERSVLKKIGSGEWLQIDYKDRISIDVELLKDVYASLDMGRVKSILTDKLHNHIADKILNSIAAEIATDVKQILSQKELREDVRATLREKVREVVGALEEA
jgi:hypothetical protein